MRKYLMLILLVAFIQAPAQTLPANAMALIEGIRPKLTEWRRHLHEHPELSNREVKTAAYIATHLKSLGMDVKTGVAKTGVVAILKGGKPGPVVALRADMDALPVTERNNLPYKSTVTTEYNGQTVGVMHACGHDTHVSILMGTAEVLSKMKKEVPGTVVFIFQPAEEGAPEGEEGGASLMVKEGVLANPKVDAIFGLHIHSDIPAGDIQYKSGAFMASADEFTIKVKGKSSHGSQPWSSVDPIYVSSMIIQGLQGVVSRESELTKAPVVITVGAIHSGVRYNIIPEEAKMIGTIRNLDKDIRKRVLAEVELVAKSIAGAYHAEAEVTFDPKTLITYNDPALVSKMIPSLQAAAGKENTREMVWTTGGEDFSYFQEEVPGFYFYLGGMPIGNDPDKAPPHHTPDFILDDSRLHVGVKAFCQLVFDYAKLK